jgi:hypothetical protein
MQLNFTAQVNGGKKHHNLTYRDATLFLIGILFIPGLNIYAAGFLSGMIGTPEVSFTTNLYQIQKTTKLHSLLHKFLIKPFSLSISF